MKAQRDLAQFDLLRTRAVRLEVLMGKIDDTLTALGSDVMNASLKGYALLRSVGEGSGLETRRQRKRRRLRRICSGPHRAMSQPSAPQCRSPRPLRRGMVR
nr:hypothetical protein [uncultured Aquabacterium sp.]